MGFPALELMGLQFSSAHGSHLPVDLPPHFQEGGEYDLLNLSEARTHSLSDKMSENSNSK